MKRFWNRAGLKSFWRRFIKTYYFYSGKLAAAIALY